MKDKKKTVEKAPNTKEAATKENEKGNAPEKQAVKERKAKAKEATPQEIKLKKTKAKEPKVKEPKENVSFRAMLKKAGARIGERFMDAVYFLQDAYSDFRFRQRKAKRKREQLRKKLPPEKYAAYRKKEILHNALLGVLAATAVVLCILLLVGFVKLIGAAGSKIFSRKTPETEIMTESEAKKIYDEKEITIGSTGCMLLHSPFIDSYPDEEGNYDFASIYQYITPYYSAPDYMTCEFEGALGGDELGYSGYPSFKSPDIIIENIRDSGVDLQFLATNHIYDGWSYAFNRTMEVYEEKGIAYTGTRKTEADQHYYIADIKGIRVGFVNYVYETTSQTDGAKSINGLILETEDAPLLNSFDYYNLDPFYEEMEENIREMKAEGAQFIIAQMHWGNEYQLEEADYQREIAQELCNMGVNAIIGGHPHCEQPIDVFENTDGNYMFCIFSEGNALSNQRTYLMMDEMPTGHTEDGAMITLTLHQDSRGEVTLQDVDLLPTWVYRYSDNDGSKYFILPLDDVANIESTMGIDGIQEEAQASYDRTTEELGEGLAKAKEVFAPAVSAAPQTESNTDTETEE